MATKQFKAITNFNTGEVSPQITGRIDIEKYQNACDVIENWLIMPQGGVKTRPGTRSIAETGGGGSYKSRLIPIGISSTDAWMGEFIGNGRIRFWKNGNQIMAGVPADIVINGNFETPPDLVAWTTIPTAPTSYASVTAYKPTANWRARLWTSNIYDPASRGSNVAGLSQNVTLTIGVTYRFSFTVVSFIPSGLNVPGGRPESNTHSVLVQGPSRQFPVNLSFNEINNPFIPGQTYTYDFVAPVTGVYTINFRLLQSALIAYQTLQGPVTLDIDNVSMTAIVTGSSPYELINSGINDGMLSGLQYAQLGDSLYLAHPSMFPKRLTRYTDNEWSLSDVQLIPPPVRDEERLISLTATLGATSGTTNITIAGAYIANGTTVANAAFMVGMGVKYRDGYGVITAVVSCTTTTVMTLNIVYPFPQLGLPANGWYITGSPKTGLTIVKTAQPASTLSPAVGEQTTLTAALPCFQLNFHTWIGKYIRAAGGVYKITGYTSTTVLTGICMKRATMEKSQGTSPNITWIIDQQPGGSWAICVESWSSGDYPSAVTIYEDRVVFAGSKSKPSSIWTSATGDYTNFGLGVYDNDPISFSLLSQPAGQIRWLASSRVMIGGTSNGEVRIAGSGDGPLTPTSVQTRAETGYGTALIVPKKVGQLLLFWQRSRKRLLALKFAFETDSYSADDLTLLAEHIAGGGIVDMDFQREYIPTLWNVRTDGTMCALTFLPDQKVYGWARHKTDGIIESVCCLPAANEDRDDVYLIVQRAGTRWIERFDESVSLDSFKENLPGGSDTFRPLSGKTAKAICTDGTIVDVTVDSLGAFTLPVVTDHSWTIGLNYISTLVTVPPEITTQEGTMQGRVKKWSELYARVLNTEGISINGEQFALGTIYNGDLRADVVERGQGARVTIIQANPKPATVLMLHGTLNMGD